MSLHNLVKGLSNLHGNIATDVWPKGAFLICKKCDFSTSASSAECGQYLARGWPTHCGVTMRLETEK